MEQQTYQESSKVLKVHSEADVIVVGGGTAGVVAAIASARTGAKTVLIEKAAFLGGTIHGGVCSMHNFFNTARINGVESKQLVKGIPDEIVSRLVERGESLGHVLSEVVNIASDYNTIIDREAYKLLTLEMMQEAGVKLFLHTNFVDVVKEDEKPVGVIIESKQGREVVYGKRLIDTTGDADVAYQAGCEIVNDLEPYSVGRIFAMANVDIKKFVSFLREKETLGLLSLTDKKTEKDNVARVFWYFGNDPRFSEFKEKTGVKLLSLTSMNEGEFTYINGINVSALGELTIEEKTRAEFETYTLIKKVSAELINSIPGFEHAYVTWTSPEAGVRRSRVVACEYDLTSEDIDHCARFEDEIGLYGYHDLPQKHSVGKGGWYGIPYRAMMPRNVDNLLVAGRMITSEKDAHMSTRNSVSCMIQGQAVGTAAALSIQHGVTPRELDPQILRDKLRKDGVLLDL